MPRTIVALSGGKASAYCAKWAFENYPKSDIVLYFNDTKWEHPDLYRFLKDLSTYFDHPITEDSDGRSPADLFFDKSALANNRMPFCSRILKAERLQNFYRDGDTLVFGIGHLEKERAIRIRQIYADVALKRKATPVLRFPLIETPETQEVISLFLRKAKIKEPLLYSLGFSHNNCSGGCVRAGKKQWKKLLEVLPEVYKAREDVEEAVRDFTGKDISIFREETLKEFRIRVEEGRLSAFYDEDIPVDECIGICSNMN